ncbi:NADPH dehydrogenase NamA [Paenibacillus senegalensis]|uniref:NADPH dehydrogenase NamA n=1 Tax=Paenibacillus senegalensis TaxID=1465766 RepID=UPI000287C196|nr:NADPH dehydrogenase NamA [Paenibacillus senegalensis]
MSQLFSPLTIRGMTLKNRIVMSPMCMYSCSRKDGIAMDWHRIHYASRAAGQTALIMLEATAVTPEGRISDQDLGIWSDEHVPHLQELTKAIHEQGSHAAIQLAHAGRKMGVDGPMWAPSAIAYNENMKVPQEMSIEQIQQTVKAFTDGARRAIAAGFDCLEIHAAHGYLINEFLSPLSNLRQDEYGGGRDRRYRFLQEIIEGIRTIWSGPLFVRISASDYHPEGNTIEDYVYYAKMMKQDGIDLIDCSSGAVVPAAITPYPGYQVPFADTIRRESEIATGAVGLITSGVQAEEIISNGRADLVFIGRALLRDPYWARTAATDLKAPLQPPKAYERGWT